MSLNHIRVSMLAGLILALLGCGNSDEAVHTNRPQEEPVDLIVDLVIEEAWTMEEMANALTETTGVVFVLAPEIDPHERMRDPYTIMSFHQNLKEHLNELEEWGLWSFEWKDGTYIIHQL